MEMTEARPDWTAFTPTDETRELASTAREHFAALAPESLLHAVAAGEGGEGPWPALVESGYTLVGVPEEHDGIGTIVDLVALLEEAGRALLPVPLTTTAAALQTLLVAGLPPQGVAEQPAAVAQSVRARGGGRGDRDGDADTPEEGLFAFDGAQARTLVAVDAVDGGSVRVRRLTADAAGLVPESSPIDASRRGAWIRGAQMADERVLPRSPDHVLSAARTCVGADLVGTAARALDASIAHASGREQFGRAIGSFQAVKHRLADLHVAIERARSLVVGAAVEVDADALSDAARELSMLAKAAATEAAERAASVHTQLLGAMGLTFEGDSQLEVRRARHTSRHLGGSGELYAAVAELRSEKGARR